MRGGKNHEGNGKKGHESGPVILRPCSFEIVKAITVYVAKKLKKDTIDPEVMLLTVYTLDKL